jgi:hypothetical protein
MAKIAILQIACDDKILPPPKDTMPTLLKYTALQMKNPVHLAAAGVFIIKS